MPALDDVQGAFARAARDVRAVDDVFEREARRRQDTLTKPPGALGRLEDAGVQLAAIARRCPPPIPEPAVVAVFAGDHGVLEQGVSPWPAEVTAQMVLNFLSGGAAVNVLARHAGAEVVVVDVGVASPLPEAPGLVHAKVRLGTADLATEAAMSLDEARRALDVGASFGRDLAGRGFGCLVMGDMGIGNTTPSAALIAALTGRPVAEVTGRGTGIDDAMLVRKIEVIEKGLERSGVDTGGSPWAGDPVEILASVGGLEVAALAGYAVAGAAAGLPVLVDGVISLAAAVVAVALVADVRGYLVAGHRSSEPGASAALRHLDLVPLLDLELRLGEGTGACLALPVLQASAKILAEMATFESAGVSEKD